MFKIKTLAIAFVVLSLSAFSQKKLPTLGKIDKTDLLLTTCPYDKDAEAYKLIDWGSVHYDRGNSEVFFKTIYQKRERIKIIKSAGLKYANITIPFYSYNNAEKITKIEAFVYSLDEQGNVKTMAVSKNSFFTKKINSYYSEVIIPFPQVNIGSVIEYKYTLERETMGNIKNWNFQDNIPVRYSEYELKIPLIFKFTIQPYISDSIEMQENTVEEMISTNQGVLRTNSLHKKFIMQNLKALPNEPYMGAVKDYQQRLEFQLSQIDYGLGQIQDIRTSWNDVINKLIEDEDFGKQFEKEIADTSSFIKELKSKHTDEQKIIFAYQYFQREFTWNNQKSIYSFNGIKKTWQTKSGSSADINILFTKLLNDAKVNAVPVLFSTIENGTINKLSPFVEQFNSVFCYIVVNTKAYVIDATNKYTPHNLIPSQINNCSGLLIKGDSANWIFAKDSSNNYKVIVATNAIIDNNGLMKGETNVISSGFAKYERLKKWNDDKSQFFEDYFSSNNQPISITNFENKKADYLNLSLEQKANFEYRLNNSSEYKYFTYNFFTDFTKNMFIADERLTDIDFGYTQDYLIYSSFIIPNEYTIEDLPKNLSFVMPNRSIIFNRFVELNDNNLTIRITIDFKNTNYSVAFYPEFKEFYKKMLEFLNEQIVLKKK